MEKQKYEIKDMESFELKHIFDCGQCFRWNEEKDGSYTGVIKQGILNVKKENGLITFEGMLDGNIKEIVIDYFDLNNNYEEIKNTKKFSPINCFFYNVLDFNSTVVSITDCERTRIRK